MEMAVNLFSEKYRPYCESIINCLDFYSMMNRDNKEPPSYQFTQDLATNFYYYKSLTDKQKKSLSRNPLTKEILEFSENMADCFYDGLSEVHKAQAVNF
ncbi:MAG: hypothetical protein J5930_07245 [Treponema sp.]|nr:hypothetical protein [Treponema sp.]